MAIRSQSLENVHTLGPSDFIHSTIFLGDDHKYQKDRRIFTTYSIAF